MKGGLEIKSHASFHRLHVKNRQWLQSVLFMGRTDQVHPGQVSSLKPGAWKTTPLKTLSVGSYVWGQHLSLPDAMFVTVNFQAACVFLSPSNLSCRNNILRGSFPCSWQERGNQSVSWSKPFGKIMGGRELKLKLRSLWPSSVRSAACLGSLLLACTGTRAFIAVLSAIAAKLATADGHQW